MRAAPRGGALIARVVVAVALVAACALEAHAAASDDEARALVEKYQCARCHEGLAAAAVPDDQHCVRCHRRVLDGRLEGVGPARLAGYRAHLVSLNAAPSLDGVGRRLRRAWVRELLADRLPHRDVRPALPATMPRLPISAREAEAIATLLVPHEDETAPPTDATDGATLWRRGECGRCHRFSGAPVDAPVPVSGRVPDGIALAPDLALTRARFQPGALARFLRDPQALAPGTAMPASALSDGEARSLAAYLLSVPLAPSRPPSPPPLLPLLQRRVGFAEVSARVLRKVCWHCHAQPDYARGDGGPGNSGGFGFAPRGLDLSSYSGVSSGARGDDGQRHSVFPDLVRRLVARQREEAGVVEPGYRGMPLGFPALSSEEIQLVASWIAQGRPE